MKEVYISLQNDESWIISKENSKKNILGVGIVFGLVP